MAPNNKSHKSSSRNHTHKKCQLGPDQEQEEEKVPAIPNDEVDPIPQEMIVPPFKTKIVWRSTLLLIFMHLMGAYGAYLLLTGQVSLKTFVVGKLQKIK
jgi:hypothetical protein